MTGRLSAAIATVVLTFAIATASAEAGVSATMNPGTYDGCAAQLAIGPDDSGVQNACQNEQENQNEHEGECEDGCENEQPAPCPVNKPPVDGEQQNEHEQQNDEHEQQNETQPPEQQMQTRVAVESQPAENRQPENQQSENQQDENQQEDEHENEQAQDPCPAPPPPPPPPNDNPPPPPPPPPPAGPPPVIAPTAVVPPPADPPLVQALAAPPALVAAADTGTPAGAVAGAQTSRAKVAVSGAGARGPGGCVQHAFKVSVLGANILRVDFSIDGHTLRRVIRRDASGRYRADVSMAGLTRTAHRIVARVAFRNGFAPRVRNLPVTFRRCAQIAISPSFTG